MKTDSPVRLVKTGPRVYGATVLDLISAAVVILITIASIAAGIIKIVGSF